MNVEKQGPQECLLATIAALQDRPLSVVREEALRIAGVAAWNLSIEPVAWWATIRAIVDDELYSAVYFYGHVETKHTRIPPRGRGTIIVREACHSHIMPWENGRIYDPQRIDLAPETLRQWLARNDAGWRVYAIRALKRPLRRKAKRTERCFLTP